MKSALRNGTIVMTSLGLGFLKDSLRMTLQFLAAHVCVCDLCSALPGQLRHLGSSGSFTCQVAASVFFSRLLLWQATQ